MRRFFQQKSVHFTVELAYTRSMSLVHNLIGGFLSVVTVTATPQLYRYPYRNSSEGLRGDMLRVGDDIEAVLGRLEEASGYSHSSNEED